MNLLKQLQKTSKWKEFEEWYNKQDYTTPMEGYLERDYIVGFDDLAFEFTKGVFEKFIEQKFEIHFDSSYTLYDKHIWKYAIDNNKLLICASFEELLIWYFNN